MTEPPFASVIVPARNEAANLPHLLRALAAQSYPSDQFEILIVDNGSTDGTRQLIENSGAELLAGGSAPNSDHARNIGLHTARGEIVAFTDADCRPDPQWLQSMVEHLTKAPQSVAGGRIQFTLEPPLTGSEVFDAMSFLNHETSIAKRDVAFTANLALRREHALHVGGIPENAAGNGDAYFARLLLRSGYPLRYVPEALVFHSPRKLRALLNKTVRLARSWGLIGGYDHFVPPDLRPATPPALGEIRSMPHLRGLWPPNVTKFLIEADLPASPPVVARTTAACGLVVATAAAARVWYTAVKLFSSSAGEQASTGYPPQAPQR